MARPRRQAAKAAQNTVVNGRHSTRLQNKVTKHMGESSDSEPEETSSRTLRSARSTRNRKAIVLSDSIDSEESNESDVSNGSRSDGSEQSSDSDLDTKNTAKEDKAKKNKPPQRKLRTRGKKVVVSSDNSEEEQEEEEQEQEEKEQSDELEEQEQEEQEQSEESEESEESDSNSEDVVPPSVKKKYLLDADPKTTRKREGDDSTIRFKYLLGLTPLFRHFIDLEASKDAAFKKRIREIDTKMSFQQTKKKGRRRKTEKEEDAQLMHDEEEEEDVAPTVLTESPSYVKQGTLREYQIQGLNWLISLYENRLSGILADEMGLGKTLQTISFLGFLRYYKNVNGPFIVIVPKSTLDNWRREFAKWTPEVSVVVLQGTKEERQQILQNQILACKFDVLITSFEMVIREKAQLKKFRWEYIVVDEAHRIKNEDSSLSQIIRLFYSRNRLLITGTPLQNNLHEVWALLNFLLPDVFGDSEVFDEWFNNEEKSSDQDKVVQQLHQLLSPFLLRRVKIDVETSLLPKIERNVYIGMTDMQVEWYRKLLEKDIDAVNGVVGKREGKTRLLNIVMQLRKCCNHPYLFDGAEPGPPYTTDEHLVNNAGKMIILDKMLKKFQKEGSRVLIFSQMSRLLDILEDYCYLRDYEYCRIDGSTSHEDRIEAIDDYNAPDSDKFIFLLTTRAGGLGINLTSADIVILFDSDWNPQADLQAMDRAHRIGQKKQVKVYRFVTENAIEEKVLERAAQKLRLDQLVIQQGRHLNSAASNSVGNSKGDLIDMIQHGAKKVFGSAKGDKSLLDDDIEAILERGAQKTATLNAKFNKLGLEDVQNFTFDNRTYEWNGHNFAKDSPSPGTLSWINPAKRERKELTYSVDNYYKDVLKVPASKAKNRDALWKPKGPKVYNIQDHHFPPPELSALLEREQLSYKKEIGYQYTLSEFGDSDDEFLADEYKSEVSREERRRVEQDKIDSVVPLSAEEHKRKQELLSQSFYNWTRRDFTNLIHAIAKFGKNDYASIAKHLGNKTPDEVERYSTKFWSCYTQIEGYDKYLSQIEASAKKSAKMINQQKLLAQKMHGLRDPLEDLKIQYPPNNSKRVYSKLEDRFILCCVQKHGLFNENLLELIKQDIMDSDLFKFDWYFLSRSTQELGRRVATLLLAITKEMEGTNKKKNGRVEPKSEEGEVKRMKVETTETN